MHQSGEVASRSGLAEHTTTAAADDVATEDSSDEDISELLSQAGDWGLRLAESVERAFASAKEKPPSDFLPDPFESIVQTISDPAEADSDTADQKDKPAITPGPPPVPNDQDVAEAYQRLRTRLPELSSVVSPANAPKLIVRLSQLQAESNPGSADYWVASMSAAKVGWSISAPDQVCEGLQSLAKIHQVSLEPLIAESFLSRHAFEENRESPSERSIRRLPGRRNVVEVSVAAAMPAGRWSFKTIRWVSWRRCSDEPAERLRRSAHADESATNQSGRHRSLGRCERRQCKRCFDCGPDTTACFCAIGSTGSRGLHAARILEWDRWLGRN